MHEMRHAQERDFPQKLPRFKPIKQTCATGGLVKRYRMEGTLATPCDGQKCRLPPRKFALSHRCCEKPNSLFARCLNHAVKEDTSWENAPD
jgi:hypothetical protein